MKLYTTLNELMTMGACYEESDWLEFMSNMDLKNRDEKFSIADGLPIAGIKDCVWALRTQKGIDTAGFLADISDLALPNFTAQYPGDRRVQRCISMILKYRVGLCSKSQLIDAANAAADADAAYAAYAAAWQKIEKLFIKHFQ